jgi:hypothetical protein
MATRRRLTLPRIVPQPKPLFTCPGLERWKTFRGQHWLVFVDESFDAFFEFRPRGFFVHGAVAIPEREYAALSAKASKLLARYRRLTSPGAQEFKSTDFRHIAYAKRKSLAFAIRTLLQEHGGFVAGFYTPLRAFVLERVRTNLLDEADALPDPVTIEYGKAESQLKAEMRGPGQAGVVSKLLYLPIGGIANLLASLECDFTVVYDPRHPKEDRAVSVDVEAYLKLHESFRDIDGDIRADLHDRFKAFQYDRTSEQEIGLQFADLVAGEVRQFFVSNPDMLIFGASQKLITPTSREPIMTATQIGSTWFKTGVLHRMPTTLCRAFTGPDPAQRTVFHAFSDLLAAGILTCYSTYGQPRDLMPFLKAIWDQIE